MGQILAIANQKGGTGKTTTALNLSAYLADFGNKVLLVDVDPQGNATSGLGIAKEPPTLYEVLSGEIPFEESVFKIDIVNNLSLIKANNNLTGIEVELIGVPKREYKLKDILEKAKNTFDLVVLDCPPSLSLLTIMSLVAADKVLVPVQAEFYALEGLAQLMNTINLVKERLNFDLSLLGVLLTMVDSRTNLSESVKLEVKKFFGDLVFHANIPRNVKLGEAPSFGKPIFLYDSTSSGAKAYFEVALEVAKRLDLKAL